MNPGSSRVIVFALWLLVFSASSQIMIISPILPQIGRELDIPSSLLGSLVSAYSIMVGIFAVISGPISDRVGRRRILLLGSGIMTVGLLLHAFVQGYGSFLAVRIFTGIAGGVLSGSAVSYVGDYFPYQRRGWATGWVMSGAAFGQILGIPVGIAMAGAFGFRSPFYLFAATMALTFLLVWRRVPQPEWERSTSPVTVRSGVSGYLEMLRRREIVAACSAYFTMFLGVSLYVVYLPTWLEQELGATANQIALLFLAGGVANVLTGPQAGRLSDRVGRKGLVILSCLGLSTVMALTTFVVHSVWAAFPLFFFTMVLVAMRVSPFSALLTALVPGNRRGSLMSLAVALGQVGFALGAGVAGPLFAGYGYVGNTLLSAGSVLLMGLVVWRLVPEPSSDGSLRGSGWTPGPEPELNATHPDSDEPHALELRS